MFILILIFGQVAFPNSSKYKLEQKTKINISKEEIKLHINDQQKCFILIIIFFFFFTTGTKLLHAFYEIIIQLCSFFFTCEESNTDIIKHTRSIFVCNKILRRSTNKKRNENDSD